MRTAAPADRKGTTRPLDRFYQAAVPTSRIGGLVYEVVVDRPYCPPGPTAERDIAERGITVWTIFDHRLNRRIRR